MKKRAAGKTVCDGYPPAPIKIEMTKMRYLTYADYMRKKYGEKVYKLPVNIPVSCPNRQFGTGGGLELSISCQNATGTGCSFCGESGAGAETLPSHLSVTAQLQENMSYIGKRYGANLFAAYFQSFTNTYLEPEKLAAYADEALRIPQIVEICVSTRPDCVSDTYLNVIREKCAEHEKQAVIELGLQSVNCHTLKKIGRGHSLAEFVDAVLRCHKAGFEVCAHVILNFPWDDADDTVEAAKIITALGVEQVKLHSLYIEKGTAMCSQYERGELQLTDAGEYVNRAVSFLEYLSPDICVQRLVSRAPEEDTVFCNWNMSWWKIRDAIEEKMQKLGIRQGDKCDYLNRDYLFFTKK